MITYDDGNTIRSEGELAEALAVFNSEYIFNVIDTHIMNRYTDHLIPIPNAVNSFKMIFDNLRIQYPDTENINRKEEEVYNEIINIICERCGLDYNPENDINKYIIASVLYECMVSKFSRYFIDFIYTTVLNEKDSIYDYLEQNNFIRDKDSETIYNLKKLSDEKLAIIMANFDKVISCLLELDIRFERFIQFAYSANSNLTELILYNFNYNGPNFCSDQLSVITNNTDFYTSFIGAIRLNFMGVSVNE